MAKTNSIYEIFASLGLDASSLDEGLKQAKFDLDAILPDVKNVQDAILQLDKAFGQSKIGLDAEARAIEFFARTTDDAAKQVYGLHAALVALKAEQGEGGRALIPTGNDDVVGRLTARAEGSRYAALVGQQAGIKKQLEAEEASSLVEAQRVAKAREVMYAEEETSRSNYVNLINQLAVEERLANNKAQRASDVTEMARINAIKKAEQQREIASDQEYIQLKRQLAAEIVAADKAKYTEEERAFQVYIRQLQTNRARRKMEMEQDREVANLEFERSRVRAPGGNGAPGAAGLGFRGTATEIQAADQLLGIHIPRGLTSVLARLGIVQTAMTAAFSGFAALAFIEILGQVGSKLHELGEEFTGFGEDAKKAWDEAYQGSRRSLLELANYEVQMGRIFDSKGSKKPLGTKLEELGMKQDTIKALRQAQIEARDDAAKKLKELGGFSPTPGLDAENTMGESLLKLIPSRGYEQYAQGAVTLGDAVDKLRQNYKDLQENINGLTKSLEALDRQKDRDISKDETNANRAKRMRDRVHEEPYRLPWYLGPEPTASFMQSLEGAPARRRNFIPGPPELRREQAPNGPEGRNPLGGPRAGLNYSPVFAPVIRVDGEATAQIVRDKIIPAIHNDYSNNQRESMDKLVGMLKAAGVQVG